MLFEAQNIGVFEEVNLEISKLTLLAGCNGSGKSTISKIIYLLINGEKKFDNYLSYELLHQLEDFEKNLKKEYPKRGQIDLFTLDEFSENPINEKLSELKNKVHNNFLDGNVILEILELFKKNIKYADNKNIELLDEFISSNYNSTIGKIIVSRMINSEYSNQLCNFNSDNMKVSLTKGNSKSFINLSNKSYNFNFNNFDISSIYYFGSSSDLEKDDLFLNYNSMTYLNIIKTDHVIDLVSSLQKTDSNLSIKDEIAQTNFIEKFDETLKKIIGGGFEYNQDLKKIFFNDGNHRVDLKNVASGAKALGALEILIKNGSINQNSMIIFDEPENNLHPMWQVKFAQFIIELISQTSIRVFINSHSPYFIDSINQISSKYDNLQNEIKFYQTDYVGDSYIIKDCSENINELFVKLAEPYDYLESELSL